MTGKTENTLGPGQGARIWTRIGRRIGKRFDEALMALAFMTRLPVPHRTASLATSVWAFPLAGALVGAIAGSILWGAWFFGLSPIVAALLALITSAMVTGALHEDGLADCADGFWGGANPEKRLAIMRDSRSGAYGVLALILVTGLKAQLLADLLVMAGPFALWVVLIVIHASARSVLPVVMHLVAPAGKTGLAARIGRPTLGAAISSVFLALLLSCSLMIGMLPWQNFAWSVPVLALASGLAALFVGRLAKAKLGGINGDSLGCMEQVAEIFCLGGLVFLGGMA